MPEIVNFPGYKNKIWIKPITKEVNGEEKRLEDFAVVIDSNVFYYLITDDNVIADGQIGKGVCLYAGWYDSPESVQAVCAFFKMCKQFYVHNDTIGDQRATIWGMIYRGTIDYENVEAKVYKFV